MRCGIIEYMWNVPWAQRITKTEILRLIKKEKEIINTLKKRKIVGTY